MLGGADTARIDAFANPGAVTGILLIQLVVGLGVASFLGRAAAPKSRSAKGGPTRIAVGTERGLASGRCVEQGEGSIGNDRDR